MSLRVFTGLRGFITFLAYVTGVAVSVVSSTVCFHVGCCVDYDVRMAEMVQTNTELSKHSQITEQENLVMKV